MDGCPIYKLRDWIDIQNVDWPTLSYNPSPAAFHLLLEHPDKIYWDGLCSNPSEWAIHLVQTHATDIFWRAVSANPYGKPLLESNFDKIQ
jgi:hypothetical protein